VRAKLKSLPDFQTKDRESDCVWLLKAIKGIMLCLEGQRFLFLSLDDAFAHYYAYRQGADTSLAMYLDEFKNLVDLLEHYGGSISSYPALLAAIKRKTNKEKAKKACDKALGLSFLKWANHCHFGKNLWTDLENQFSRGNNQYPNNLTEAYSLLVSYKAEKSGQQRLPNPDRWLTARNYWRSHRAHFYPSHHSRHGWGHAHAHHLLQL